MKVEITADMDTKTRQIGETVEIEIKVYGLRQAFDGKPDVAKVGDALKAAVDIMADQLGKDWPPNMESAAFTFKGSEYSAEIALTGTGRMYARAGEDEEE